MESMETMNKLFLELSQVVTAKTAREMQNLSAIAMFKCQVDVAAEANAKLAQENMAMRRETRELREIIDQMAKERDGLRESNHDTGRRKVLEGRVSRLRNTLRETKTKLVAISKLAQEIIEPGDTSGGNDGD